jgi:hypothetical protein
MKNVKQKSAQNKMKCCFLLIVCILGASFYSCENTSTGPTDSGGKPIITLHGKYPFDTLVVGIPYSDPGAKAVDPEDGDLDIEISGEVDYSKTGTDTIIYTATDSKGNVESRSRIVVKIHSTDLEEKVNPSAFGLNLFDDASINYKLESREHVVGTGITFILGRHTKWRCLGTILIDGGQVLIEEGVKIFFEPNSHIMVRRGSLLIAGTDSAKVTLTALRDNPWGLIDTVSDPEYNGAGIIFQRDASTTSYINHCMIDSAYTGIYVDVDGVAIQNCSFSNIPKIALHFDNSGPNATKRFIGNKFIGNGSGRDTYPIKIPALFVERLGVCEFTNNSPNAILVTPHELKNGGEWKKQKVPYVVEGPVVVNIAESKDSVLKIEPGTELRLKAGAFFDVINGGLIANGTKEDSIKFAACDSSNFWGYDYKSSNKTANALRSYGINFWETANAISSISYCVIENATTGINISSTPIAISNTSIKDNLYAGIHALVDGSENVSDTSIYYENNGKSSKDDLILMQ